MMRVKRHAPVGLLLCFFAAQLVFWHQTLHRLPELGVVPDVPGKPALHVLAFGDDEFLFRLMGFILGNAGDTFGRSTALKEYDLKKVEKWFLLLDQFDDRSNLLPFMASYYFSQTQKHEDVRYMVDYLYEHSWRRPAVKYWWLAQGAYLALHRLHDKDLAIKLAEPLKNARGAPMWAQQLPAFVFEERGEMEDAKNIIEHILANEKNIPENEIKFMRYFV